MPTLLYYSKADPAERWREALEAEMPELELRFHPEIGDPAEIDYALVFKAPPGLLASLPNLKAIFSITAGIDHFRGDPELPAGVPIVRMIDDYLQAMMAEYAIYAVLHFHRFFDLYRMDQRAGTWR
ncbi:MAG TPA: glyoxylate/hydroxypyruvate reductase A, partial [Alphaproteobacteria bacterium]|nr:glyoxylate/hydroxypyruvate reductase A [Alphaproteobacteria bacterium]